MLRPLQRRYLVFLLLVTALAVRVGAGIWWQRNLGDDRRFGFSDSESYWHLAQQIARGEDYEYGKDVRIFRTPGYPILLAGWFSITGSDEPSVASARVLSAMLGTLTVAAVVWLTSILLDDRAALIAGLMATFYPGAIALSVFVLAEALFCPLMVVQLICWSAAWKCQCSKRRATLAFVGGVLAGAATLARPSWLLFTPFALTIAIALTREKKKHLFVGTCMIVGLCCAMAPWWIRNYQVAGRFVPTTLQVGASLYDGLHPGATGASDMQFVSQFSAEQRQADQLATSPLVGTFEDRLDTRLRDASIDWARKHPGRVVSLMGIKFLRMWNPLPNASEFQSWRLRIIVMVGYAPLIVLGVWGAWEFSKRGWPYVLCFLPAIYFTLLHVVFVSSIRYRQPAMLSMIVLAAGVVALLVQRKNESMESAKS